MLNKYLLMSLVPVALLAACTSTPPLQDSVSPNLTVVDSLPSAGPIDPVTQLPITPLGPYDVITFTVVGIEDLDREMTIDGEGTVSIPIAGRIKAAGLTPAQLEHQVEAGLRANFVRDPDVAINLKEMFSQRVTVEGAVERPGSYPILPGMTLLRSVASAEGLSEFAKSTEVVVFRTIDGSRYATLYDLRAIREGRYDDPTIYPQDIVVVGESETARMINRILTLAPGLLSPISVLLTR